MSNRPGKSKPKRAPSTPPETTAPSAVTVAPIASTPGPETGGVTGGAAATAVVTPPVPTATLTVVPIGSITPDAANVRRRDERATSTLYGSLVQFGPARSIVLDKHNIVRAGNGTLEAAAKAGVTDVLIVDAEPGQIVAVRRKDWTATESTGYSIADNRLSDLSTFDETGLASQLRSLQSESFDLASVGFTGGELDAMIERLGTGLLPAGADGKEYDESVADSVEYLECPECHHKWPA